VLQASLVAAAIGCLLFSAFPYLLGWLAGQAVQLAMNRADVSERRRAQASEPNRR